MDVETSGGQTRELGGGKPVGRPRRFGPSRGQATQFIRIIPPPIELTDWEAIELAAEKAARGRRSYTSGMVKRQETYSTRERNPMSAREMLLEAIRGMPESASPEQLVRAIHDRLATMTTDWNADQLSTDEWRRSRRQGLSDELADSREDIYTLADGEPIHESG